MKKLSAVFIQEPLKIFAKSIMVVALLMIGCRDQTVNQEPLAVSVARQFYSSLEADDMKIAYSYISTFFKRNTGENWLTILESIQVKAGIVISAEFKGISSIKMPLPELADSPCYLLSYSVIRKSATTEERLLICQLQDSSKAWMIEGHSITFNKKYIVGGVMSLPSNVRLPGTN
ncbi:MAG: hypothetical protein IPL99_12185 [Candidatus Competibacteraceae bacterium]|nr:hypothetical protein [Candidatus Competibacteraceae bacterium]